MGNPIICVPQARRRHSKWYGQLRQKKHLLVWVAMLVAMVLLLGYGARAFLKQAGVEDSSNQQKIRIDRRFTNPHK